MNLKVIIKEAGEIGVLCLLVIITIVIGAAGAVLGDWLAQVVTRVGASGAPAQWVAQITGFAAAVLVGTSAAARIADGKWWWR